MARLGGFLAASKRARSASEEAVHRRLWHRLPWLALGLAGAMLSAGIVGSFEDELEAEVLLAFFVPAVVYMADAVGTQTETVVIRGMALGVCLRRIARGARDGARHRRAYRRRVLSRCASFWGDADVAAAVPRLVRQLLDRDRRRDGPPVRSFATSDVTRLSAPARSDVIQDLSRSSSTSLSRLASS